tara:strand:- start:2091 stop:2600 length:510 start_codon:yes stop_codon:yes gene_type:complete
MSTLWWRDHIDKPRTCRELLNDAVIKAMDKEVIDKIRKIAEGPTLQEKIEALCDLFAEYDHKMMEEGAISVPVFDEPGGRCPMKTVLSRSGTRCIPDRVCIFGHVRWLCGRGIVHATSGRLEDALMCLGFLQGILWGQDVYPMQELIKHNAGLGWAADQQETECTQSEA